VAVHALVPLVLSVSAGFSETRTWAAPALPLNPGKTPASGMDSRGGMQ
jgi:hypothetical protein